MVVLGRLSDYAADQPCGLCLRYSSRSVAILGVSALDPMFFRVYFIVNTLEQLSS